ncbi:MAG: DUF456 domain-containing protein [Acidimicrobiales bacterium]
MPTAGLVMVAVMIVVGLIGIVVPVFPALLLVWAAVVVWALAERTGPAWAVLAGATVVFLVSQVVKYLIPGRRLQEAGVPTLSMLAGVIVGIVGFFVVPVVGVFLGFVVGIYAAELLRLRDHRAAWPSTVHALKAAGISVLIELVAGLLIASGWLAAVIVL